MPLLGAHMSAAGGLHLAFGRIRKVQGRSMQIFTRNQRRWTAPPVTPAEAGQFIAAWREWGTFPVAAHDSYLINLASPKPGVATKSLRALIDELQRCEKLHIPCLVIHPGSHLGEGPEAGIERVAANLDLALAETEGGVMILLETTAGQGSGIGCRFQELAAIMEQSARQDRLGVCFDTCHVFAAGYELRTEEGYGRTMAEFDRLIGLDRLRFFHLNDSRQELGSRVDRHTHIGEGEIGLAGFRLLLNDPRFRNHPMVLETPKGKGLKEDIENLGRLAALLEE